MAAPVVYILQQYGAATELFATIEEAMDCGMGSNDPADWEVEERDAAGKAIGWTKGDGEDEVFVVEVEVPAVTVAAIRATTP